MNIRKGLGKGLGMGYKNIVQRDPYIHSLSAKGISTYKQQLQSIQKELTDTIIQYEKQEKIIAKVERKVRKTKKYLALEKKLKNIRKEYGILSKEEYKLRGETDSEQPINKLLTEGSGRHSVYYERDYTYGSGRLETNIKPEVLTAIKKHIPLYKLTQSQVEDLVELLSNFVEEKPENEERLKRLREIDRLKNRLDREENKINNLQSKLELRADSKYSKKLTLLNNKETRLEEKLKELKQAPRKQAQQKVYNDEVVKAIAKDLNLHFEKIE